ncbi:MAG: NAD-dependent malic enzyme [bacterium]
MPTSPYFSLKHKDDGSLYMEVNLTGIALLSLGAVNKGTAFTKEERRELRLEGLLPPLENSMEVQVSRSYRYFRREPTPIAQYQYLRALQERNEVLFFALLVEHLEEMMPIVYTPTVGLAVQQYSHLYQMPRGLSFSSYNIDCAEKVVHNYPYNDVRMVVVTDSSAILGIGDQGYGGIGIAIGKLALYTAGGGVSPYHTLPVKLDVGTDRETLLTDEYYLGTRERRLRGDRYLAFTDQFVEAINKRWPNAVIQWEDFSKDVAFTLLDRYRDRLPSFNDDIQGTGAVALSGVLAACASKGETLKDQTVAISGAGAGGVGVAWAIVQGMMREGLSEQEAHARVMVLDSRGLLVEGRSMDGYKMPYAQKRSRIEDWNTEGDNPTLLETLQNSGTTVLLGLSGQPDSFTESMIKTMLKSTDAPIVFPLSNPTSSCEALPEDILLWTDGKAFVATGSPFAPVEHNGHSYPIGQGNNAFIFPGLGFATILSSARKITDNMIMAAAYALAEYTHEHHIPNGLIFPPIGELQAVSRVVTEAVIKQVLEDGVAGRTDLADMDIDTYIEEHFWQPEYLEMKPASE